jgi:prepilin-type N-terminal cleavage/methylation domain-containing protein/prepilin-type processing-associated H-X9-DG protein
MHKRGFTLVELLVVVAIIALLMAILMPALRKAREQGKDAICKNNLRQIGFGANLYAEDWDSQIPRGWGGDPGQTWYMLFMPYLAQRPVDNDYRNVRIYYCPSYPDPEQTVCYVVNGWEFSSETDMVGGETIKPTTLSECRNLASTIYLVDNEYGSWRPIIRRADGIGWNLCDVWDPGHLPSSNSQDTYRGRRIARDRHKDRGCNSLFLDWHIEWIAADKMTINMWRFKK